MMGKRDRDSQVRKEYGIGLFWKRGKKETQTERRRRREGKKREKDLAIVSTIHWCESTYYFLFPLS